MYNSIILSIKPEFIQKIFSGEKRYEFRKRIWVNPVEKCFTYATDPIQKIVGFFTVKHIYYHSPLALWYKFHQHAGINEKEFFDYYGDRKQGYAIAIEDVFEFKKFVDPYSISGDFNPPQNFYYVTPGKLQDKLNQTIATCILSHDKKHNPFGCDFVSHLNYQMQKNPSHAKDLHSEFDEVRLTQNFLNKLNDQLKLKVENNLTKEDFMMMRLANGMKPPKEYFLGIRDDDQNREVPIIRKKERTEVIKK